MSILWALVPSGLMNIYITGLNQVGGEMVIVLMGRDCYTRPIPLSRTWALNVGVFACFPFQVTDVEIDKINKPDLPIAAGQLSKSHAKMVVGLSLVLGLAFAATSGATFASPALTAVLLSSAFLGTIYSLPPFRLKRFPLLAALCIISVRGSIVSLL